LLYCVAVKAVPDIVWVSLAIGRKTAPEMSVNFVTLDVSLA